MARATDAIADNAAGDLFVDSSCIDCDLCRQLAPDTFARTDRFAQSFVAKQPANDSQQHRALLALITCPTSSIGMRRKLDATAAARAFPIPVDGSPSSVASSWDEQLRSIAKLAAYDFRHVLPSHGRPFHATSADAMRAALAAIS